MSSLNDELFQLSSQLKLENDNNLRYPFTSHLQKEFFVDSFIDNNIALNNGTESMDDDFFVDFKTDILNFKEKPFEHAYKVEEDCSSQNSLRQLGKESLDDDSHFPVFQSATRKKKINKKQKSFKQDSRLSLVFETPVKQKKSCSCKKNKCNKLSCLCYSSSKKCMKGCTCMNCFNQKPAIAIKKTICLNLSSQSKKRVLKKSIMLKKFNFIN